MCAIDTPHAHVGKIRNLRKARLLSGQLPKLNSKECQGERDGLNFTPFRDIITNPNLSLGLSANLFSQSPVVLSTQ